MMTPEQQAILDLKDEIISLRQATFEAIDSIHEDLEVLLREREQAKLKAIKAGEGYYNETN